MRSFIFELILAENIGAVAYWKKSAKHLLYDEFKLYNTLSRQINTHSGTWWKTLLFCVWSRNTNFSAFLDSSDLLYMSVKVQIKVPFSSRWYWTAKPKPQQRSMVQVPPWVQLYKFWQEWLFAAIHQKWTKKAQMRKERALLLSFPSLWAPRSELWSDV